MLIGVQKNIHYKHEHLEMYDYLQEPYRNLTNNPSSIVKKFKETVMIKYILIKGLIRLKITPIKKNTIRQFLYS